MPNYLSDRGDRYTVAAMDTSHLINVITHHRSQIETLKALGPQFLDRIAMLHKVISVLRDELATRDVSITEYLP